MTQAPAYPRLLAGLVALLDVDPRDGGLCALNDLLESGAEAVGAREVTFAEYTPTGGRVVAATRAARWALGYPVAVTDPAVLRLLAGPRTVECPVDDLPAEVAAHLSGRGLHRVMVARAEVGRRLVGSVHAAFADRDGCCTDEQSAIITSIASAAAKRYDTQARGRERGRDLIAVLSHELRTPVTVIKGFADTLTEHWDSFDDDARRDAVRVVRHRAEDLARLVDRLLCAACDLDVSAGDERVPFDLVGALREAVERLPAHLRRGLRVDLPATLPHARGDRASVAIVLTELVTNAYKYSPAPARASLVARADPGTVHFQVADRGIGIRPDDVELAFERFWQGEVGDQRGHGGVGLGLYLVRRIIERQNGWVFLRHRELGGTVAEVRLPRADVAPGEA